MPVLVRLSDAVRSRWGADPAEAEGRRAVGEAQRALRKAERAHRARVRQLRRALAQAERAHAKAVAEAEGELRRAERVDEEATRRARAAIAYAQRRRELGRYGDIVLLEDALETRSGRVELTSRVRAVPARGAQLAVTERAALAVAAAEGGPAARLLDELGRHPDRFYLLLAAPGFLELVRCSPDDAAAHDFAAQVNVAALNAEVFADRRAQEVARAEAELAELERRREAAIEEAQAKLERVRADTAAVEAAREELRRAEADTAEVERCREELRRAQAALPAQSG